MFPLSEIKMKSRNHSLVVELEKEVRTSEGIQLGNRSGQLPAADGRRVVGGSGRSRGCTGGGRRRRAGFAAAGRAGPRTAPGEARSPTGSRSRGRAGLRWQPAGGAVGGRRGWRRRPPPSGKLGSGQSRGRTGETESGRRGGLGLRESDQLWPKVDCWTIC